ncbi:MAG TPA: cysteine desulfurase-like protein [Longimicrobiales bacterium]|nr:cysteine desulfurase-like protein [Longimicrobiales bacterium]
MRAGDSDVDWIEAVRATFPALRRRLGNHPVAYFDGPGGTQVPTPVIDAVSNYLAHHNANTHWEYPTSRETDRLLESARECMGAFLGADPHGVAFGANMTTLTFHVARAVGRGLTPGAEMVVTELDHHANVAPWRAVAAERGLGLRTVALDPATGRLDEADLRGALRERPAVVAVTAASNVLGTVNDVAAITREAHAVGALVFVDAVHFAAHGLVDAAAWDCDLLACSAYKFYGPHVGVLWGRPELLQRLDLPRLDPAPQQAPERAETGTQNHEGIVGAAAAVDFIAGLASTPTEGAVERSRVPSPEGSGVPSPSPRRRRLTHAYERLERRSAELGDLLRDGLGRTPGVSVHGPSSGPRTATVAFTIAGVSADAAAAWLADERGLFLSHGDFYAPTVLDRYGAQPGGFLRAGCACYTKREEVERLLEAVGELTRSAPGP